MSILVVDIETTGMAPPAALIELGFQEVRLRSDGVWTPNPDIWGAELFGIPSGQTMSADNRAVHHIDPATLYRMPLFVAEEYIPHDQDVVCAHNSAFEQQWLTWDMPWICTFKCALRSPLTQDAPSKSNQALKYWLGIGDHERHHPPHRALPDARVTAEILSVLLNEHGQDQLLEWTRLPRLITRMPFGKHREELLRDIPSDYLRWVASPRCDAAEPDLVHACGEEISRRMRGDA